MINYNDQFPSVVVEIIPCPHCHGTGAIEAVKRRVFTKSYAWAEAIHRRTGKWPKGWSAEENNATT